MNLLEDIKSKTAEELKEALQEWDIPSFRSGQIFRWLQQGVSSFDEMTNLPKNLRERLAGRFYIAGASVARKQVSQIDGTVKYLLRLNDGEHVECVLMEYHHGLSICISTQVGCRMGCTFCATGKSGYSRNLTASEILSEVQTIQKDAGRRISNIVLMGMGEPLDNYENVMRAITVLTSDWGFGWSPKRITLSTIGVLPALKRYLDESRCHLAVSLHDPFPDERLSIMPAEKAWPAADILDLVRQYDFTGQRRVSFEYTMFAGFNDTIRHADALSRMLRGLECRVNLIRFHRIPDFPYSCPPDAVIRRFQERLNSNGVVATVRASRGEDILAACGMLAGRHENK